MSIRPLAILDLPYLYGFRDEVVGLDATRALTRGNPLGAVGLLSYINPSQHIYSVVANGEEKSVLGGITHVHDETFAKLYYIAPSSQLDHPDLPALIENLTEQAGTWGAFHVIAEVDETNNAFISLRNAGFSVYAWQRMWDISEIAGSNSKSSWTRVKSVHVPSLQGLYHQIVPPLLHPVEPQPKAAGGWMCNEGEKCYISMAHGLQGIVLTPLIHPEATNVSGKLSALIGNLPDRRNRPVYICVRSYQAWLEPVLADLGAKAAERQAVMVKHLVHMVKDAALARKAQPAGVSVQPSRVSKIVEKK
ncbi:MAG: hypothetical protein R3307_09615 [Anaerolineales bacterium]|nr:hypothetical protein [Anaerolineales bacterium]